MNQIDKKFQIVNLIGLSLLFINMILGDYIYEGLFSEMITAFSAGWILSLWLLRYLTLKEQSVNAMKTSETLKQDLIKEYNLKDK